MKYILIAFATVLIKGLAFADAIHDAAAKGDLRLLRMGEGVGAFDPKVPTFYLCAP